MTFRPLLDSFAKAAQFHYMNDQSNILDQLGVRLKEARAAKGLSLDAVAKLSGVSRSMVSQIERGESSPTIATLLNLTRALQVDFAGLLEDSSRPAITVTRAGDVPMIDQRGTGCRIQILSPPEEAGKTELYILEFDSGGVLDSQPHAHGARESLTVVSGMLEVSSGGETDVLNTGDSARYAADLPHKIAANTGPARAFLVVQGG